DQTRYRPAGKYAGPSAQRQPDASLSSRAWPFTSAMKRGSWTTKGRVFCVGGVLSGSGMRSSAFGRLDADGTIGLPVWSLQAPRIRERSPARSEPADQHHIGDAAPASRRAGAIASD